MPEAIRRTWPRPDEELKRAANPDLAGVRKQFAMAKKMVRLMRECGVQILAGTDTGDPFTVPGDTLHRELELLVTAGLTPMEAIQSATSEATKFIGWDQSMGTLKRGMLADLVLLDADPLADIANVRKISGVAVRGKYLDRARLNSLLGAKGRKPARKRNRGVPAPGVLVAKSHRDDGLQRRQVQTFSLHLRLTWPGSRANI